MTQFDRRTILRAAWRALLDWRDQWSLDEFA
jgi:hypothetical protein